MRTKTKIVSAAAIVAALAAGGSAFTASNTLPAATVGYGSVTVTGATATDIAYSLTADGTKIAQEVITFSTAPTGATVTAGWDGQATLGACTLAGAVATCVDGVTSTATATSFHVAVAQQ
ncbi:MAG: hypothetical protein ACRDV3_14230 [Acidothermaceae bacterium]